jgi:hypothetical protein
VEPEPEPKLFVSAPTTLEPRVNKFCNLLQVLDFAVVTKDMVEYPAKMGKK